MSIQITSTTDSQEAVTAAMGDLAISEKVEDTKSAPSKNAESEITEESDTSKSEESEVLDTKDGEDEDSENDESDTKEGDQKPKKKGGFKKRIDGLISKLSAKDQEVEYWKQEALKRNSSEKENTQAKSPVKEAETGRPKEDDFGTHAEFIEALTDWKMDQRDKVKETKSLEDQIKSERDNALKSHFSRVEKFVETHDDFHEVIEGVPMPVVVQDVILASENGPELMYELAKNRNEYERICSLPYTLAALELGKFVAKISKPSESSQSKQEVKTTKAPSPVKPVGSKGVAVKKTIYDQNISQREYEKMREEQERERYA